MMLSKIERLHRKKTTSHSEQAVKILNRVKLIRDVYLHLVLPRSLLKLTVHYF